MTNNINNMPGGVKAWQRKPGLKVRIIRVNNYWDFPGGAVVKNPPANAGNTDSIPGPGGSHMPRSN